MKFHPKFSKFVTKKIFKCCRKKSILKSSNSLCDILSGSLTNQKKLIEKTLKTLINQDPNKGWSSITKLLKESVAIIPFLENKITLKDAEIERSVRTIESLEADNERLKPEIECLQEKKARRRWRKGKE